MTSSAAHFGTAAYSPGARKTSGRALLPSRTAVINEKTDSLLMKSHFIYIQKRSFYQDRLATDIGKAALKKQSGVVLFCCLTDSLAGEPWKGRQVDSGFAQADYALRNAAW
eukprot:COSAG06_NODE_31609_length_518_cov_1.945107_1_plen_111_part_00